MRLQRTIASWVLVGGLLSVLVILAGCSPSKLASEVAIACLALALMGLWISLLLLLGGYELHGVWDFFQHPVPVGAQISQRWYPPLCVGFDWAIALAIFTQQIG